MSVFDKEFFYFVSWILVAFGWIVSFGLAFVTFKKNEVRKAVDSIVKNLEECSGVAVGNWRDQNISESMFDQEVGGIVARIDLYNKLIEKKSGTSFLEQSDFILIYNITADYGRICDLDGPEIEKRIYEAGSACNQLIYSVEHAYYEYSMSRGVVNSLCSFPVRNPELFGGGLVFLFMIVMYLLLNHFFDV